MISRVLPPFVAASLIFASIVAAQTPPARSGGYLSADARPQAQRILPPPPSAGSGRQADDEAIFARTRTLAGGPRWSLATADADLSPGAGLFACALGTTLGAGNAPTLQRLLFRVRVDELAMVNASKDVFARPRPFVAAAGDPAICVPKSADLVRSASYPSGHATLGWAWALILAQLAPDRATEILMRGREIGESRVVCGVHYLSDVEAGRANGSMLVAALQADPAFRADLDRARAEMQAARAAPHAAPAACDVINDAAAHPLH